MDATIIVALCGLIGTAIGSIGGVMATSKLVNYRLQQLEKKVDLHNNLVVRMTTTEVCQKNMQEKLEDLIKRINEEE